MASQSLYRKWRSQTFGDLVGQEPVIRTLKNALNSGNLAHAYLFTGPRGTGKTSTARLLAKTINCLHPENGEPCNVCEQCIEITAGNSFNVTEIDAASNRGIDSIRELREKVMVPPSTGKYKIYILDEAHMLTVEAFNALLKTLEEPPPHAIFVMATTDVHKMLPTVLSRCQRFDFKRITSRQIVEHLQFVAGEEHVQVETSAAELIARAAAGGMRDALSLLDQAIAYSGNSISLAQVQTMLGVADPRAIQKFILHVAELDTAAGLHLIHELSEAGADLRQINTQIAEYWRAMMLSRAGASIADILDNTQDEIRDIQQTAQLFNLEELAECARVFAQNDLVQKSQGTPQLGLELALLNCTDIHRRAHTRATSATNTVSSINTPVASLSPRPASAQDRPRMTTVPVAAPAATFSPPRIETPPPAPVKAAAPTPALHVTPAASYPGDQAVEVKTPALDLLESAEIDSEPEEPLEDLPDWDNLSYQDDEPEDDRDIDGPLVVQKPVEVLDDLDAEPVTEPEPEPIFVADDTSSNVPDLTIDEVKEKWEYVKRRVRTRKDGPKIAAFLNGYSIVGIEGTRDLPVVVIRAVADFHYKSLQKPEYYEAINWALKVELNQECNVRLLPPGAIGGAGSGVLIPPPVQPDRPNGSVQATPPASNTMVAPAPLQSAYRERPAPSAVRTVPEPVRPQPARSATSQTHSASASMRPPVAPRQEPAATRTVVANSQPDIPLARKSVVRENTTTVASPMGETRQQSIEQKVKNDPVIKELMRMFKAEIKDIQPQ